MVEVVVTGGTDVVDEPDARRTGAVVVVAPARFSTVVTDLMTGALVTEADGMMRYVDCGATDEEGVPVDTDGAVDVDT